MDLEKQISKVITDTCTHWICADETELNKCCNELSEEFNSIIEDEIVRRQSEKTSVSGLNLHSVMPMLHQIAKCLDNTIETTEDDNEAEWDKICDAVELLNDIAEDNKGFVRN